MLLQGKEILELDTCKQGFETEIAAKSWDQKELPSDGSGPTEEFTAPGNHKAAFCCLGSLLAKEMSFGKYKLQVYKIKLCIIHMLWNTPTWDVTLKPGPSPVILQST